MSDRVRERGVSGVGRIAISNLWSILAEVADMRGKWGRPLCPPPSTSPHSTSFLVSATPPPPIIPWVAWSALRGKHAAEQADNFQADCFYFRPDQGLMKTNWQNKGQQINDPCPPLPKTPTPTIDSWLGMSLPFLPSPPLLSSILPLLSWLLIPFKSRMHRHTYLDIDTLTYTRAHTSLLPSPSSLTPWPVASGLDCHRKRETETYRGKEWVSERKRPLCLCLDLHYHVLILMQFEKETDMETHWVKRGLSVLSGTACSHSPDMLPTRKSRARLYSLRRVLHCHFTTRFQAVVNTWLMMLHGFDITLAFALQCNEI